MRCFTLAHGWRQAGRDVEFLHSCTPAALTEQLQAQGVQPSSMTAAVGSIEEAREYYGGAARPSQGGHAALALGVNWGVLLGTMPGCG